MQFPAGYQNRKETRRLDAIGRRPHRKLGMGNGKHALNGNKFRYLHVNWFKRIVKEMKQCPRVIEWTLRDRSNQYL